MVGLTGIVEIVGEMVVRSVVTISEVDFVELNIVVDTTVNVTLNTFSSNCVPKVSQETFS